MKQRKQIGGTRGRERRKETGQLIQREMKNGNLESGIATRHEVSETDAKPTRANRIKRSSSEAKDAGEPEQGDDLPKGEHNSDPHRAHSEQSDLGCARALHRRLKLPKLGEHCDRCAERS